ncbi:MAG: superoxide dismutase [Lachnospiraceae bacterium]|nr:superoxide dismutase [Lachnospiraceae bacterium]
MYSMIELPYGMDALEPYYSEETLRIHYEKLYKGYVDNLNKVEEKLDIARKSNDYSNIKCLEKDLAFYGAGKHLHEKFFLNLGPKNEAKASDRLLNRIKEDFGSFENFTNQFDEASKVVEASGWCILVWSTNLKKLEILQCEKHQNLSMWGCIPILIIDMWEHSYFLQYKQDRQEYINNFWNIVNWNEVNKTFEKVYNRCFILW